MNNTAKNKWQIRIGVLLVFVLGFAAGMLALNVYRTWAARARSSREDRFEQMSTRLQLNADQKMKVQQVFGDARDQLGGVRKESEPRVNDIRKQTDQRLQQILTPDQWQRFQQMRDEMRARRGRDGRDEAP